MHARVCRRCRPDHAHAVLEVAFGMLDVVRRVRGPFNEPIQVRIGVHSGPVVAGVLFVVSVTGMPSAMQLERLSENLERL